MAICLFPTGELTQGRRGRFVESGQMKPRETFWWDCSWVVEMWHRQERRLCTPEQLVPGVRWLFLYP